MEQTCPKCGGTYTAEQAGGLCPRCLAEMAAHPTGGEPVEELPLTPGRAFRGLDVLELVGRGGMGVVYKARQPHLDRLVALKILPRKLASDPEFRQRFGREARALAALTHPNIVGVYDFGFEDDLTFLVMEFVDGVNLREVLRERRLAPREAIEIVPQLCDALQYAHGEGVVHRDIKPENILIDKKGRVKIADFGLAKIVGGTMTRLQTITQSNVAMGTPHYMAPEQLESPKEVDHRADIYSMGVVFYEMLTGELPIGRFEPPSHKVEVDVRLDEVVLKTLEKAPGRRYQHASEVKDDMTRLTVAAPVARARIPVWVAAALAVVALAAVLFAVFQPRSAPVTVTSGTLPAEELRRRRAEKRAELEKLETKYTGAHPQVATARQEYDRIEAELAKLEGRAPKPWRVFRFEDMLLTEKDLPEGYRWIDAKHRVEKGSTSDVSRLYEFSLADVEVRIFEIEPSGSVAKFATECRANIHAGAIEVVEQDRLVAVVTFTGDPALQSIRLYDALVRRVSEKMGVSAPSLTGARFELSPGAAYLGNRRGGTSTLQDLVFDPKRPRLYVSDHGTGSVLVFSTKEHQLIGEIPVGRMPQAMDIDPDGARLYAAVEDRVAVVDLEKLAVEKTLPAGGTPYSLRRVDDKLVVTLVDPPTRVKVIGGPEVNVEGCAYPLLLVDSKSERLYVVGRGEESVVDLLKWPTLEREKTWRLAGAADAAMKDGELVMVPRGLPEVRRIRIDGETPKLAGVLKLDKAGGALALGRDGQIFVATGSNEISIFESRGGVRTLTVGAAADPAPGLFVSPDGRCIYMLAADRLSRVHLPIYDEPRYEVVDLLGRPVRERLMALLKRMGLDNEHRDTRELLARGDAALDILTDGIENAAEEQTVSNVIYLLNQGKHPRHAERVLAVVGKFSKRLDYPILGCVIASGALNDPAFRGKFSDRFRSEYPHHVCSGNLGVVRESGSREAMDESLKSLDAWMIAWERAFENIHACWSAACRLLGREPLDLKTFAKDPAGQIKGLAGWWKENRDALKWNAAKGSFEK